MRQAYDKWLAGAYLFTRWTLVTFTLQRDSDAAGERGNLNTT
jgi:hypothetical protein